MAVPVLQWPSILVVKDLISGSIIPSWFIKNDCKRSLSQSGGIPKIRNVFPPFVGLDGCVISDAGNICELKSR